MGSFSKFFSLHFVQIKFWYRDSRVWLLVGYSVLHWSFKWWPKLAKRRNWELRFFLSAILIVLVWGRHSRNRCSYFTLDDMSCLYNWLPRFPRPKTIVGIDFLDWTGVTLHSICANLREFGVSFLCKIVVFLQSIIGKVMLGVTEIKK